MPFTPTTKDELHYAVQSYMNGDRSNGYMHQWDVSRITDMCNLFSNMTTFNESISNWDVSNVTTMANMFYNCTYFNQDLSDWDVSQVTDMSCMFYGCSNFTGLSHKKKWSCISSWNTQNVINMTSMFENAVLFTAKIRDWDVHNVVYANNFSKNCCHMRHVLPRFSKQALTLPLTVPLDSDIEVDSDEPVQSPIMTSAQQLYPIRVTPDNTNPLRYTPPFQLLSAASPLITSAVKKISPVISPEVEYLGTKKPSPEVEYLGTKKPSPEVEYLGTKKPSPVISPEVEYLGTKKPSPEVEYLGTKKGIWSMPDFFTESTDKSGGYKRKKIRKTKNKKNKKKSTKKIINEILVTDLAY
jgi:surface protein